MDQVSNPIDDMKSVRRMIAKRAMEAERLRDSMLSQAAATRKDLNNLKNTKRRLEAVRKKPWLATLHLGQERVSRAGWDAYVNKFVFPRPRVALPPDDEVDVDLLMMRLISAGEQVLPPPEQKCETNFFPPFSARQLLPEAKTEHAVVLCARLPNSLLVRLLWTTGTLRNAATARALLRGRLHEDPLAELPESPGQLQAGQARARHRRCAFDDTSDAAMAALDEATWAMGQPLQIRRRRPRRGSSPGKRKKSLRQSARSSRSSRARKSQQSPRESRASSAPSASSVTASSAQDSERESGGRRSRREVSLPPVAGPPVHLLAASPEPLSERADSVTSSKARSATGDPEIVDNRPVFKTVIGNVEEKAVVSMFTGENYEESRRRADAYMKSVYGRSWMMSLMPEVAVQKDITPWELTDMLTDRIPLNDPKIAHRAIREVKRLVDEFSCQNRDALIRKMLAILRENYEEVSVFEPTLDLLETSLKVSWDQLIPLLLGLYPISPDGTRAAIEAYLVRAGLRDPAQLLRRELASWRPGPASKLEGATLITVMTRKASRFIQEWQDMYESSARLVAEELREEHLRARVKADIISALNKHEPTVVTLGKDELSLKLAEPPSAEFFGPLDSIVEVLNYFVEMCEPTEEDEVGEPQLRLGEDTQEDLHWRRDNKDLILGRRSGRTLRGHLPLSAGLQRPTVLVTHMPHGLEPVPWPPLTVRVSLRIAGKFFFHKRSAGGGDNRNG